MSGHKAVLVDEGFLLKLIRDSKFEIPDNLMDKMASSSRKMDSALASDSRAFDQVNNYNDELVSFQIAKDKKLALPGVKDPVFPNPDAQNLYNKLKENEMNINDKQEILLKGNTIKDSNVVDVINRLTTANASLASKGVDDVISLIQEKEIESDVIKNLNALDKILKISDIDKDKSLLNEKDKSLLGKRPGRPPGSKSSPKKKQAKTRDRSVENSSLRPISSPTKTSSPRNSPHILRGSSSSPRKKLPTKSSSPRKKPPAKTVSPRNSPHNLRASSPNKKNKLTSFPEKWSQK